MEEMYGFHSTSSYTISSENNLISPAEIPGFHSSVDHCWPFYGSDDLLSVAASVITDEVSIETAPEQIILPRRRINQKRDHQAKITRVDVGDGDDADADDDASGDTIKVNIASHPSYSKLLDAYIDCQKVGAPPEIASLLDDIRQEHVVRKQNATSSTCLGADPELDEFMETFYLLLVKYKSDLTRPFDEATIFLDNIEKQFRSLNKDEGLNSADEEVDRGETDGTHMSQELKDTLLRKFGGRIGSLKQAFTKKKKKGKLPLEARHTLLDWWSSHSKWPYPTEGDKMSLAETTGLDPKQINNWFINQRKRHWKPTDSMQLAIMAGGLPIVPGGHYTNYDD